MPKLHACTTLKKVLTHPAFLFDFQRCQYRQASAAYLALCPHIRQPRHLPLRPRHLHRLRRSPGVNLINILSV
jgi:hypothetical protein